ncbi:4-(cytidine 5'-diphospho)-2-C-methyl-D-erythritol kinase [Caloramator sp. Dgby_cultured_2]|uniref:4-(cytidine 5'-diphospho)-2-C-methyl-D-erythritol kinase n=1 Tax=Caloramator sp. Dgby_cultured_2 TaxID=3029174 RepID=UPI00237D534C|nr:4-(cytidine 5'-diphospho)-2-C-methyl-D-erythritol kinase [Caloramator sp. Dgby_cultured_2]WDU82608.1 4-(cytidine 5'-diphospho)-2-C-methyl-D-erythritol kinase [Caloramator sp. Dgby_cultured_2]
MERIEIKCPAKVNLSLDVVGKRDDGYHLLRMINQSVSLYDYLTIEKIKSGIIIISDKNDIPLDESNTCYRAADLIFKKFGVDYGVKIHLKRIFPTVQALEGKLRRSGVIKALNELYDLKMSKEQMMEIGLKVGADVPFSIVNRTSLVEGIGEIISPIEKIENLHIVIAKPNINISTKEVYSKLRLDEINKRPNIDKMVEYIRNKNYKMMASNMVNVLETVTLNEYPILLEIKNIMMEFEAEGSIMTGSGSAVIGVFEDEEKAKVCYNRLRDYIKDVFLVKTVNEGV